MLIRKIGLPAPCVLAAGAVATSAGILSYSLAVVTGGTRGAGRPGTAGRQATRRRQCWSRPGPDVRRRPCPRPRGQARAAASTMIYARNKAMRSAWCQRVHPATIGQARADAEGRFRIEAPRTSSRGIELFGSAAIAPGYGVGWAELDRDDDQPAADIQLRLEQVIQGRLFDLQGQPCQGVQVTMQSMGPVVDPQPATPVASSPLSSISGRTHASDLPRLAETGDDRRHGPVHGARSGTKLESDPEHHGPSLRPSVHRRRDRR